MSLTAYGVPLSQVTSFKYLVQVIAAEDNVWSVVVRNLQRARQEWWRLTRILSRVVSDARTLVQIYLVVFQSFMLYGLYTWVLTPRIKRVLGGFHHRVACRLTGGQPWIVRDRGLF